MGGGSFSFSDYDRVSRATSHKSVDEVFTSKTISNLLDPKGVKIRESRDSAANPASTAIILALDVTGSMGSVAHAIATKGLGVAFNEILTRKPVTDPHMMCMAIGDANYDLAPLQVSQFESDNKIVDQTLKIYVEAGGGNNNSESYHFPWYFAAMHTSIDCFEKRGKKGYLFTMGDEFTPPALKKSQIAEFIGDDAQSDLTAAELLEMASRTYHVFHIIIEQGSCARMYPDKVAKSWVELMGQSVIRCSDYTKLAEIIVSAIQVVEGEDKAMVSASWSGDTSMVVSKALSGLPAKVGDSADLVRL